MMQLSLDPNPLATLGRIRELEARVDEYEETLGAIRRGDFDAVVTKGETTLHRIYTLENADSPYRVLIEQLQEGAITVTVEGSVCYCNHRLAEMLETPQERVIGQHLARFIRWQDRPALAALLAEAACGQARGELTLTGFSGVETPVNLSLSRLPNDGGRPLLCGVMADLTAQKRHVRELSDSNARLMEAEAHRKVIEETLLQSQKMEAVGQLTGGLAHDFNNLLAVILGNLELIGIELQGAGLSGLQEYVEAATASVERGTALAHRLLAFSRRQTLAPKLVSPARLIRGMQDLLQRATGPAMTLQIVLPEHIGAIFCDANQLENAILNLAINARDAMPVGGTLTIAAENVDLDEAFARPRGMAPGRFVKLSVTDTGAGMPPRVAARAFDPFFTTKPQGQGTGLGLSMIYGFAQQSGGHASIHSLEAVGTTVCIFLPRHSGTMAAAPSAPPPDAARRADSGETVLLVDDEPGICKLVVITLEKLGYTVIQTGDSSSALRHFQGTTRIDLLLTDVCLEGGINGRQLADAARALRSDLKVLFITGYAGAALTENGFLEPGMEVMSKPFALAALALRVGTMIKGGG
jgi:PAS domain S-box-containing protein